LTRRAGVKPLVDEVRRLLQVGAVAWKLAD
jgi:hypothetical protein